MKRRATTQGGRRQAVAATEHDENEEPQSDQSQESTVDATATTTNANAVGSADGVRGGGRVTTARAQFFATGAAPPPSMSAAAQRRSARSSGNTANANHSSWPGYYATAHDLAQQRQAARDTREEELQRVADGTANPEEGEQEVWIPKRKPRTVIRTTNSVIPPLHEMALRTIAQHIQVMPTLEYVDSTARHQVANAVVKLRHMKPDVLPLFIFPGVTEIDIPDCSMIDETAFVEAIQHCTAPSTEEKQQLVLTILRLGLCGRCVSDSVIFDLGDALHTVEQLALRGCYRLSDAGMEVLVRRCAPSLCDFALSCNQRISQRSMELVGEFQHLHSLSLSECPQLDDTALAPLCTMKTLRALELNQMERISDGFIIEMTAQLPLLEELSLARCAQLSDVAIRAALENCRKLRVIDFSDLHQLTEASMEPIQRLGHPMQAVTIRRCLGLNDMAIQYLAAGAHEFLERLEMSSVPELTDAALKALQAHCASSLKTLDISFCRAISEDRLGLFTDETKALTSLSLWGCTQITARFLTCHSRDDLIITGHPLLTGLTIKY